MDSASQAIESLHKTVLDGHNVSVSSVPDDQEQKLTKMLREVTASKSDVSSLIDQLSSLSLEDRKAVMAAIIGSQRTEEHSPSIPVPGVVHPSPPTVVQMSGLPKLSLFSGVEGKGEVSFKQWHFEVSTLIEERSHPESFLLQIIRKSLRGRAAELLTTLGARVSVVGILAKFSGLFGEVYSSESLRGEFYTAKQNDAESAASWACRLEELLGKLQSCETGLDQSALIQMKRDRFFNGLTSLNLRSALRHHYDLGASYDKLLMAARVAELEQPKDDKLQCQKGKISQISSDPMVTVLNEIKKDMREMKNRLLKLESRKSTGSVAEPSQNRGRSINNNYGHRGESPSTCRPVSRDIVGKFSGKCFKCNKYAGHMARSCPLNEQRPMSGGSQ
jgi:hypothetical protein